MFLYSTYKYLKNKDDFEKISGFSDLGEYVESEKSFVSLFDVDMKFNTNDGKFEYTNYGEGSYAHTKFFGYYLHHVSKPDYTHQLNRVHWVKDGLSFCNEISDCGVFENILNYCYNMFNDIKSSSSYSTKYRNISFFNLAFMCYDLFSNIYKLYWPYYVRQASGNRLLYEIRDSAMDYNKPSQLPNVDNITKVLPDDPDGEYILEPQEPFISYINNSPYDDVMINKIKGSINNNNYGLYDNNLMKFFPADFIGNKFADDHYFIVDNLAKYLSVVKNEFIIYLDSLLGLDTKILELVEGINENFELASNYLDKSEINIDKNLYNELVFPYSSAPIQYDSTQFFRLNNVAVTDKKEYKLIKSKVGDFNNGKILAVGIPNGLVESLNNNLSSKIKINVFKKNFNKSGDESVDNVGSYLFDLKYRYINEYEDVVGFDDGGSHSVSELDDNLEEVNEQLSCALKKYVEVMYSANFDEDIFSKTDNIAKIDNISDLNRFFNNEVVYEIFDSLDFELDENQNYIGKNDIDNINRNMLKKVLYCISGMPKNVFSKLLSEKYFRKVYFIHVPDNVNLQESVNLDQFFVEIEKEKHGKDVGKFKDIKSGIDLKTKFVDIDL